MMAHKLREVSDTLLSNDVLSLRIECSYTGKSFLSKFPKVETYEVSNFLIKQWSQRSTFLSLEVRQACIFSYGVLLFMHGQ